MKVFNTTYLKGNTIIEVLIALAITSFCASLAVLIYLNIQKSSLPFFKVKGLELAELYMKDTLNKHTFFEENYKSEEFVIKKTIRSHELFNDCFVIRLIVFDVNKKKIAELESTARKD